MEVNEVEHAPNTKFLKEISEKLNKTGIPIYYKLPGPEIIEPFYVIGNHFDDDTKSAKFGAAIVNTDLQIDLFYPVNSRAKVEDVIYQTKSALRTKKISTNIRPDNTIGREVYHVVFKISDYIF